MPELRFSAALNMALKDAMETDDRVILLGEDIGEAGGPFTVTRGLKGKFGDRVRDTPISEATITGAAVGAALTGLRPVVEIMFMDFITLAMDALVNQAAKAHFMFGGQASVPMVVRTPHGGGLSAGPQHSQCLEAWFCHVPGLKVVVPSTPADAYGLLRAAIDDPDPVIFVENKSLYATKGMVSAPPDVVAIGQANVLREGADATVITYGSCVFMALAAAEALVGDGIQTEVVDLRSLQPWDVETVVSSVSKTGRLIVVHEAVTDFGVGAEIVATVAERAFRNLRAPPIRVGAEFSPVPFAPNLERQFRPDEAKIKAAVTRAVNWSSTNTTRAKK